MAISPKSLLRILIHGRSDEPPKTRARIVLRWVRIAVLIVTALVTLQSVLLVAAMLPLRGSLSIATTALILVVPVVIGVVIVIAGL